jgi:hypothetical protein
LLGLAPVAPARWLTAFFAAFAGCCDDFFFATALVVLRIIAFTSDWRGNGPAHRQPGRAIGVDGSRYLAERLAASNNVRAAFDQRDCEVSRTSPSGSRDRDISLGRRNFPVRFWRHSPDATSRDWLANVDAEGRGRVAG